MKKEISVLLIVVSIIVISTVAYHSIQEIHWLKGFYPNTFNVEEAKDASIVELVKVLLVSIPLIIVIWICLSLLGKG